MFPYIHGQVVWPLFILLCLFGILDNGVVYGARGGARGGSRGGSYSSYRSGGYSSYRSGGYSSYRSSGYSTRYTSYSGTRLYSSYATSYQPYRYTRMYAGYRGYYYYYYNMYFYHSHSYAYYRRSGYNDGGSQGVCVNYEANNNGTVMGVFTCPLPFEPSGFTACCGEKYAEYCCKPTKEVDISYLRILLPVISFVAFILIFALCVCCKKHQMHRKVIQPAPQGNRPPPPPPGHPRPQQGRPPPPGAFHISDPRNNQPYQRNNQSNGQQPGTYNNPAFSPVQPPPYPADGPNGMPKPPTGPVQPAYPPTAPPAYSENTGEPLPPPPKYEDRDRY